MITTAPEARTSSATLAVAADAVLEMVDTPQTAAAVGTGSSLSPVRPR
jgi:hypothetical protein